MALKDWKYFNLRKIAGYEKWIYASGEKIIELEKAKYKTTYPYIIKIENYVGQGSRTEFAKTRNGALKKIKNYIKHSDLYRVW